MLYSFIANLTDVSSLLRNSVTNQGRAQLAAGLALFEVIIEKAAYILMLMRQYRFLRWAY